jgi:phosphotransferase system enzyme I (PtsI)
LYLSKNSTPTLEEQINDYAEIFREAPNGPITVRTLDPEGDKRVAFLPLPELETVQNYRVLEFHREFLELQLQAISAAGKEAGREIWVMAPQIGSANEAIEFVALAKKFEFEKVGVMVELPALVDELPLLSGKVDFLSVGTNDLAQNIFGINRMIATKPELLDPWHPDFVSMLSQIAATGKTAGLRLSVCGEVAANPAFAIRLAELGYDSVSVAPSAVASVTEALRS